jgi:N-succinyldiaminopimelate aminotransferase
MSLRRPTRLKHIAGIGVDRMGSLADESGRDLLRLENLDTDIPPDPEAVARTRESAARDADNSYLPFVGQRHLRDVVARYVSAVSGVSYRGERNCIISAGGLSGILNVLLATVDVGDEVIVTDPTYIGLVNRVHLAGGIPRFVPFQFTAGGQWALDRDALRAAVGANVRAMLLMSPSMPSGACFDRDDWKLICDLCVANDLLLILDTAMERLVYDGREIVHPAKYPGMEERTITVGSSAKELRMIGWRVGWIVAPEPLVRPIERLQQNLSISVPTLSQIAAEAAFDGREEMEAIKRGYQENRQILIEGFPRAGLTKFLPADGAFYLYADVSDFTADSFAFANEMLEKTHVAATPGVDFDPIHGRAFIRFSYARSADDMREAVARIARWLG